MITRKITIFLTMILLLAFFVGNASARVFRVDVNGDPDTTFANLASALVTAAGWTGTGHIIEIEDGTYTDNGLSVSTKVAEIKAVGSAVIFQAPVSSYQAVDFLDVSGTSGLKISGFTIMEYRKGLEGANISGLIVENMIFDKNGIDGCGVDGGYGISLSNCDNGMFDNVEIMNGETGILLAGGSDGNTIQLSKMHDLEGIGICVSLGDNNTIDDCEVFNCLDRGIEFGAAGSNSGNVVKYCTVYDCNSDGILITLATSGTIRNNLIHGCASTNVVCSTIGTKPVHGGIYMDGAGGITDNVAYNNGSYGIYVVGTYFDVGGNCLYGHTQAPQAYDQNGGSYWHGNYYGAYVSVPHNIAGGGSQDWSPKTFTNTAYSSTNTWEIYETTHNTYKVDLKWGIPNCDPWETLGLASYNFTVHYDPSILELVGKDYYFTMMGPGDGSTGATYAPIGHDPVAGTISFAAANYVALAYGNGDFGYATFKVKGVGPTSITITSVYQDSLNNAITVTDVPLGLTLVDTQKPAMVSASGRAIVSDAASSCYDPALLVILDNVMASASDNFNLARIWWKFDNPTAPAPGWNVLVGGLSGTSGGTSTPVTIPTNTLLDGDHTLYFVAEDAAGNLSNALGIPVKVDRTGPVLDNLILYDKDRHAPVAQWTDDPKVDVELTNNDGTAVKMQLSEGFGWQAIIDYDPSFEYSFTHGPMAYTYYAKLYDSYGNCNAYLTYSMTYDNTIPAPTGWVLAGGATKVNTRNITGLIGWYGPGYGVDLYDLNYNEDISKLVYGDPGWQLLPLNPVNITLQDLDGWRKVYYAIRDNAGNISIPLVDSVLLDRVAPELTSFDIQGDCVPARTVTINFTWDGSTDAKWIHMGVVSGTYTKHVDISAMNPANASTTFTLPNLDGPYTVYAKLEDDITNKSVTEWSDNTILDRGIPTLAGVTIRDLDYGTDPLVNGDWSNDGTVNLVLAGLSADVIKIIISQTGLFAGEEVTVNVSGITNPFIYQYEYQNPVDCQWNSIYVKAMDCAGNKSTPAVSDNVYFDMAATSTPTIASFDITPDPTNSLTVNLSINAADNCWPSTPSYMRIYEDGYGPGTWVNYIPNTTFPLQDIGDGTRTLNLYVADMAGNVAGPQPATVLVDKTKPIGTIAIVSTDPNSLPEYTRVWTVNLSFDYSLDVEKMWIKDAGGQTYEINVAPTYAWTLNGGAPGYGNNTVSVWFKDHAGNWSDQIDGTIFYDNVTPSAPTAGTATGTPGGSCKLEWQQPTQGYKYFIRYNYTGEYPTYEDGWPPHPGWGEGHEVGWVSGCEYDFEGPLMDIYSFSIWTMDSAGNISTDYNVDVVSTNYILGDLNNDDTLQFGADLGYLASSYGLDTGDPGFNPACDYGPTHNLLRTGLPLPDGHINFDDLVIAAMNYAIYGDWKSKKGSKGDSPFEDYDGDKLGVGPVAITAQVPEKILAGVEYTISFTASDVSNIMAFHLVLGYDNEALKITRVTQGAMFDTEEPAFFYNRTEGNELLMDGAIFGPNVKFTDREIAQVTFVAGTDLGQLNLKDMQLILRDSRNGEIRATFGVTKTVELLIPREFALSQNYPNPFNPVTTIKLSLPVASDYLLEIFNIAGQRVQSFSGYSEAGIVTVTWDANDLSSGIYFYRVRADKFSAAKKMVLLK